MWSRRHSYTDRAILDWEVVNPNFLSMLGPSSHFWLSSIVTIPRPLLVRSPIPTPVLARLICGFRLMHTHLEKLHLISPHGPMARTLLCYICG